MITWLTPDKMKYNWEDKNQWQDKLQNSFLCSKIFNLILGTPIKGLQETGKFPWLNTICFAMLPVIFNVILQSNLGKSQLIVYPSPPYQLTKAQAHQYLNLGNPIRWYWEQGDSCRDQQPIKNSLIISILKPYPSLIPFHNHVIHIPLFVISISRSPIQYWTFPSRGLQVTDVYFEKQN